MDYGLVLIPIFVLALFNSIPSIPPLHLERDAVIPTYNDTIRLIVNYHASLQNISNEAREEGYHRIPLILRLRRDMWRYIHHDAIMYRRLSHDLYSPHITKGIHDIYEVLTYNILVYNLYFDDHPYQVTDVSYKILERITILKNIF